MNAPPVVHHPRQCVHWTFLDANTSKLLDSTEQTLPGARSVPGVGVGRIVGRLLAVGGPAGVSVASLRGRVELIAGRRTVAAAHVDRRGGFTVAAAAGMYSLSGRSPQFRIDGRMASCNALRPAVIRGGQATQLNVYCQRR
jgi:hypothetical protein